MVHSAAIQDRDGAALVLDRIRQRFNWLELIWADGAYNDRQVESLVAEQPPLRVEIVKRPDDASGFIVLPRRWVVERTFSWFGRNRRLAKDYEKVYCRASRLRARRMQARAMKAARVSARFLVGEVGLEPTKA